MRKENPPINLAFNCSYCGTCLYFCPVYQKTGIETFSPRGKVNLLQGIMDGELEENEYIQYIFSMCALCQRCVENCPSGIDITNLIVDMRAELNQDSFFPLRQESKRPIKSRLKRQLSILLSRNMSLFICLLLRYRWLYETNLKMAYILQKLLPQKRKMINWLPYPLQGWTSARLMRPVAKKSFKRQWQKIVRSKKENKSSNKRYHSKRPMG